ncbi:hypothetical protein FA15DRAFT_760004 [Coprinopsis marcescibilis]|uniref:Uncharacterized protein n=1 Tax=Coprinopsis marcescibilis TaxID=230819 RepID=A0A5C3KHR0_COPMA|nr:hypothetical protein FA15DRAFT_760004 [Coprinopsis marcescibilis]
MRTGILAVIFTLVVGAYAEYSRILDIFNRGEVWCCPTHTESTASPIAVRIDGDDHFQCNYTDNTKCAYHPITGSAASDSNDDSCWSKAHFNPSFFAPCPGTVPNPTRGSIMKHPKVFWQ